MANSLTFQGEMSSPNMLLEARMTRLEREMTEMREVHNNDYQHYMHNLRDTDYT